MKITLLLFLTISIISCNQISEEDRLVHNQKVISGIAKKKADLDKILSDLDSKSKLLSAEFENVRAFKIGRSSTTKRMQIAELEKNSKMIYAYRDRVNTLKHQLNMLHKTFEWQKNPTSVLEKVFEIARNKNYGTAIFLADPYDENDGDVNAIAYIAIHPQEYKEEFIKTFQEGRIIGEPIIANDKAKIEFLYGPNTKQKETMNLVKRNESWYLVSF